MNTKNVEFFKAPMTLAELDATLHERGIKLVVNHITVDYDEHNVGQSVYVTIKAVDHMYQRKND